MVLLEFGIFKVNISNIFGLCLGIAMSLALCVLIYLLYVINKMNSKKYKEENKIVIEDEEISVKLSKKDKKKLALLNEKKLKENTNKEIVCNMIDEYQMLFLDSKFKSGGNITYAKELSLSLVKNIAKLYYPESENAMLEISVEDTMTLLRYITKRIDALLNYDGLRFIKSVKISTIYNVTMYKKVIDNLKITKTLKKYNLTKILSGFKFIINFVNPFYWVRKAIIDTSFKIITKKICVQTIAIVGAEAYYIYSHSVFNDYKEEVMLIED